MHDVRITRIVSRAVNAPLTYPVHTAVGTVATAPLVLIDLETDAGVTGHAYLFAYTPVALKALKQILDDMSSLVVDQPLAPADIEAMLARRFCLPGFTGLIRMAGSGIDMAAWDALAKVYNQPLAQLLGAKPRPIPTYDSHSMDGVKLATQRAVESAEAGFKAVKTKIGYATVEQDLEVVRSMQEAVGANVSIMVDHNQSLNVAEAIRRERKLQDVGVAWIEEPTNHYDYTGHHASKAALDVPL